jgi:hypothetical protein
MQYILSVLVMISVVFFGMELVVPVGAATSTVSGEAKLQISGTHMKRSILERKIRMMQSELKKTATAISLAEKKITYLVSK